MSHAIQNLTASEKHQTRSDLLAGADLLETKGWTTGSFARDATGAICDLEHGECFCVAGALRYVTTNKGRRRIHVNLRYHRACEALKIHMSISLHAGAGAIMWNDAQPSAATVIAALRSTAENL